VGGARDCPYDKSHAGATARNDDYCAPGSDEKFAGTFRTTVKFIARNEDGVAVHRKADTSDPTDVSC
jgi:hypothetical protein